MSETSPGPEGEQDGRGRPDSRPHSRFTVADLLTLARLPLAAAFLLVPDYGWRLAILAAAGLSDLLDGPLARRFGSSRLGAVLDPAADKLFVAVAVVVVAGSGRLEPYEIVVLLLRDLVAVAAFAATLVSRRPRAIAARPGGKAVTMAQMLTLVAFLTRSPLLRPMAWATGALALYAIWDYYRVAPEAGRRIGG